MQPDLVGIIEAIYQLEDDASSWIQRTLECLAPGCGDGVGLFGFTYVVSPKTEVHPGAFAAVGCSDDALSVLPRAATLHDPDFLREGYLRADLGIASVIPGWHRSEGREYAVRGGIEDVWAINGRNSCDRGCTLCINRRREGVPSPRDQQVFVRVAAHIAAAHRLRDRLRSADAMQRAEAILATDGKIQHAVGDAKEPSSRDDLCSAARSLDRVRARLRREDPERALEEWKGLVSARWTLVDHFESDGRRYILAQENQVEPASAPELSARERQVLANAALGRSNKEIAYALGLAHSTVRVLMGRAATKLRATSRRELMERYDAIVRRGTS
jgi:DNA-binding CsgD family transcriptional regulator